ncbi:hypothetical protein ACIQFZ_41375 [Streptomyces sp. NPDC093064]|uniref:hypothetical protein n=1 Tax=unclassified Streptomyces TaxID=2593676 RepID=UPI00369B4A60
MEVGEVPAAVGVAVLALKAGRWQLHADWHCIELTPRPRRSCRQCRGAGGWWTGGPSPTSTRRSSP